MDSINKIKSPIIKIRLNFSFRSDRIHWTEVLSNLQTARINRGRKINTPASERGIAIRSKNLQLSVYQRVHRAGSNPASSIACSHSRFDKNQRGSLLDSSRIKKALSVAAMIWPLKKYHFLICIISSDELLTDRNVPPPRLPM